MKGTGFTFPRTGFSFCRLRLHFKRTFCSHRFAFTKKIILTLNRFLFPLLTLGQNSALRFLQSLSRTTDQSRKGAVLGRWERASVPQPWAVLLGFCFLPASSSHNIRGTLLTLPPLVSLSPAHIPLLGATKAPPEAPRNTNGKQWTGPGYYESLLHMAGFSL